MPTDQSPGKVQWLGWHRAHHPFPLTMLDGDVIFTLSTGAKKADVSIIGAFATEVMAQAILRAVKMAKAAGGLPGLNKT